MRKIFIISVVLLLTITSCKKSSTSSTPTSSTWTLKGVTYKGIHTEYSLSNSQYSFDDLTSSDASGNAITLSFYATPVNGTYTVVDNNPADNTQCEIIAHIFNGETYFSMGQAGDKVNVTVSGGKITGSFTNVSMEGDGVGSSNYDTTIVSGTIIQQ